MIFGTRNILVNTATKGKEVLIAAEVSSGFNAAIQYGTTGEVKLSDVIGGYYTAELKGEDPFMGAILSKTGSSVGYVAGSIQIPFTKYFNPVSQKYEMRPTGVWSITKPVPEHNLPPIIGNIGDSLSGGITEHVLEDKVKGK